MNADVHIWAADGLEREAAFLQTYLAELTGLQLPISTQKQRKVQYIELSISPKVTAAEGYVLTVSKQGISIKGGSAAGVFYGIQTLRKALNAQLSPLTTTHHSPLTTHQIELPPVEISDAPRFSYRGMHLDCSRHFFSISFIKKYINLLALHNMNVFHWHLSDDQGWRIEMK